jgi:hypothetical protein
MKRPRTNLSIGKLFFRFVIPCVAYSLLNMMALANAAVIYNTFGPSDVFSHIFGDAVDGPQVSVGNPRAVAFPFTPGFTATFNTAELPLGTTVFGLGPNHFQVQLRVDQGGLPGVVLETFDLFNLPMIFSDPGTVLVTSSVHPLLKMGTQYWLAALPVAADTSGTWLLAVPDQRGNGALTPDIGQTWRLNEFGPPLIAAFRITGTEVPEPAALTLFGFGGLALLSRIRAGAAVF